MFNNCRNSQERKDLFRKLAKKAHPDLGGSHEQMKALLAAYEAAEKAGDPPKDLRQENADFFRRHATEHGYTDPTKFWRGAQPQPDPTFSWTSESEFPYESAFKRAQKNGGMPQDAIMAGDVRLDVFEYVRNNYSSLEAYNFTLMRLLQCEINQKGWVSKELYAKAKIMLEECNKEWCYKDKAQRDEERRQERAREVRREAERLIAEQERIRKEAEEALARKAEEDRLMAEQEAREIERIRRGKSWACRAYDWLMKGMNR